MADTISYNSISDRYCVHLGYGTLYNMVEDFATLEQAENMARCLACAYKSATGADAKILYNF